MTTPTTSAAPGPLPGTVAATPTTDYPRRADGTINWRALVPAASLYVKGEWKDTVAKLLSKTVTEIRDLTPEDVVRVPDRYLVIRKAGLLELARLRGYSRAIPHVVHAQRDYVIVETLIDWLPLGDEPAKTTGGVGEATPENTTELGARYLAANAQNRAFARAVRDFLEIDIVCSDELGRDGQEPEQKASRVEDSSVHAALDLTPQGNLTRAAAEGSFSFEQVKAGALARWNEDNVTLTKDPSFRRRIENDPTAWTCFKDVPPRDCLTLIGLIKARVAASAQVKAQKEAEATQAAANPPPPAPAPQAAAPKKRTTKATPPTTSAEPQQAAA